MVCLGPSPRSLLPALLLLVGCARTPVVAAGGLAVLSTSRAEFGTVFEGQVLAHVWRVAAGEGAVVREMHSDCGCTVVALERERAGLREPYAPGEPLAAGEVLDVRATFDTRGRLGPAVRRVTLTLADGTLVPLELAAEVRPWLALEPTSLPFQRLTEGTPASVEFEVHSLGGEPFRLTPTGRAIPPAVTLEPRALAPDAQGRAARWHVVARLGADAPRGTHSWPLELATDVSVPGGERVYLAAPAWNVQVLGPVALSSPSLEFGLVRANETLAKSVRLESFEPGFTLAEPRVRLEPLRPDEPLALASTAHLRVRPDGQAFDIELTLAGLAPEVPANFLARLVVETGHPRLPTLEALVRGVRAPEGVSR